MPYRYTGTEIIKILTDHGFTAYGWRGSHFRMNRDNVIVHIPNPQRQLTTGLTKKILRKAGIKLEEQKGKQ